MRPTMCYIDTMRVAGRHKPTKSIMLLAYLKKCMHIHSPGTSTTSEYAYEYDYLKARYFGGKKNE